MIIRYTKNSVRGEKLFWMLFTKNSLKLNIKIVALLDKCSKNGPHNFIGILSTSLNF